MMQLHHDHDEFVRRDALIVAIGPENAESFQKHWDKYQLSFVGLPDEKHMVLKLYGQQVKLFKLGRMPGQMIVDKKGVLRYVHYGHSMEDIPENKEIMELLDALQLE
jgi:peroxiredoxin Q/BCP